MAAFSCNLKVFRQRKGLTQEQLADLVGVRRVTTTRLEQDLGPLQIPAPTRKAENSYAVFCL